MFNLDQFHGSGYGIIAFMTTSLTRLLIHSCITAGIVLGPTSLAIRAQSVEQVEEAIRANMATKQKPKLPCPAENTAKPEESKAACLAGLKEANKLWKSLAIDGPPFNKAFAAVYPKKQMDQSGTWTGPGDKATIGAWAKGKYPTGGEKCVTAVAQVIDGGGTGTKFKFDGKTVYHLTDALANMGGGCTIFFVKNSPGGQIVGIGFHTGQNTSQQTKYKLYYINPDWTEMVNVKGQLDLAK